MRCAEISAGTPEDEIDDASRHAGIGEGANEFSRGTRRFFRRFDDDRTTRRQRGAELARDLVDRKIPRRERCDRPDRLFQNQIGDLWRTRRDDAAISAPRLFGKPIESIGGDADFDFGFLDRLALFARHDVRDLFAPLAQEHRGAAQDFPALESRYGAPDGKAFLGRRQRRVEVGDLGTRGPLPITSSVAGLITSSVRPLAPGRHAPSMKRETSTAIASFATAAEAAGFMRSSYSAGDGVSLGLNRHGA